MVSAALRSIQDSNRLKQIRINHVISAHYKGSFFRRTLGLVFHSCSQYAETLGADLAGITDRGTLYA